MLASRPVIVSLALVGSLSMPVQAQSDLPDAATTAPESGVRVAGSFGVGLGSQGAAALLALALRTDAGDFVVRSAGTFNAELFGRMEEVTDVALLYGRLREGDDSWFRFAAGPSYVDSRRSGEIRECFFFFCSYEIERESSFGLALQAEGAFRPRRTLGVGISGFANINGHHGFLGGVLTLHVGRMSRRTDG